MRLGELLVQQGLATAAQVDEALERQAKSHMFLGDILVDMRVLNTLQLTRMLELQSRLAREQGSK